MGYKLACEKYHRRTKNPYGRGRDRRIDKGVPDGRQLRMSYDDEADKVTVLHATRGRRKFRYDLDRRKAHVIAERLLVLANRAT